MKTSKSLLILSITFFLFTLSLNAQTTIGLRSGVNFSTLIIEGPDINGSSSFDANGINLGAFLNIPVGKKFSIQPEFTYDRKSTSLFNFNLSGEPSFKANLIFNSIDLSVLAKYRFGNEKLGFSILAGPSLNTLINAAFKMKAGGSSVKVKIPFNGLGMDRLEMGAIFGTAFNYQIGPGKMILDVRYNLGLTDIFYGTGVTRNQSIGFSLGYAIKI